MMSSLSLVEATLPPGFRFHPTDGELICDYLFNKQLHLLINNNSLSPHDSSSSSSSSSSSHHQRLLLEIDLNKCEPWDLPETACVGGKEWYFYSQRDRKYATGLRTNRATVSGYWKATGKDRSIFGSRKKAGIVGMRKTLVFYLGRAPKGKKTDWVMHEFRLQPSPAPPHHYHVDNWVLCRVFCKTREIVDDDDIDNNIGKLQTAVSNYKKQKVRHEEDAFLLSSCCSSLPQLMEQPPATVNNNNTSNNYYQLISSFDNDNQLQQVPCFSTILPNPQFADDDDDHLIINPHYLFTSTTTTQPMPPNRSSSSLLSSSSSSLCCENKEAVKSVLSRFHNSHCNFKDSTPTSLTSFGEGISDQSFLSDAALPVTMWYP